jgi:signal transduction histidine kinase/HAMP domain-containing protein/ActR/RegA family two-component response regulator
MVDQLSSFADEVTRVAREVGTEGKLGGQAQVTGVAGTWRDLTDNVNQLAGNLTGQVRNIAQVTTAVARGDLSQKITVDARGEILELKSTVNTMVDQLSSFADEVTRVAREVGTEGKLGGQAQVTGVAGTWRDLTENVNQLASTLTSQLRAIAAVSTAVTMGDLTQQVQVAARGEVAELKDNINQMIVALRETTGKNAAQVWLDSNLARMAGLLQGQRDPGAVCQLLMNEVAPLVDAHSGAFFLAEDSEPDTVAIDGPGPDQAGPRWRRRGGYALDTAAPESFGAGEGLIGQAGITQQVVHVERVAVPELSVRTGVHTLPPAAVAVLPVVFEGHTLGVVEFGTLAMFSDLHLRFLERLAATIGVTLATIQANQRTERLLTQSQRLAGELQDQSIELQRTNAELQDKASLLSEQNHNIELKNLEIEAARRGVEEQAEQLAQASRYKSEFLANMSHELRTPLNSMLLLSRLLADNPDGSLTDKQREFATAIHNAGNDLRVLIDDILDLSKIEAGRVQLEYHVTHLDTEREELLLAFAPQAEDKHLAFGVTMADGLPHPFVTDSHRLRQILRNLVSNALKFTESGGVTVTIDHAPYLDDPNGTQEGHAPAIAFAVTDTGIGIPGHQLNTIFEAFAQADGTTSRSYGGTGLGLSISRELAHMLGGTLTVTSTPGQGSTFTLLLPNHPTPTTLTGTTIPQAIEPPLFAADGPPLVTSRDSTWVTVELAGVEVLIVDDDVRNVFALTSALEIRGINVHYADNGHDAIRLVKNRPEIDIVLMDVMMPGLDGNETTREIRELPHGRLLPIVFLTAKAAPEDRDAAVAAGATDYLTKPVDLDRLLTAISQALDPAPRSSNLAIRS